MFKVKNLQQLSQIHLVLSIPAVYFIALFAGIGYEWMSNNTALVVRDNVFTRQVGIMKAE